MSLAPVLPPLGHAVHPNAGHCLLGAIHALTAASVDADAAQCLSGLVALGGETDSVAAIAGSLLGAPSGDTGIRAERVTDTAHMRPRAVAVAAATQGPAPGAGVAGRELLFFTTVLL